MTQLVEAPAAKPDKLSFISLTHMVEGEHQLPSFVLCSPHSWCVSTAFTDIIKIKDIFYMKSYS